MTSKKLATLARKVSKDHVDSDVEAALAFCESTVAAFVGESNDRLVKVGRSIRSLVELFPKEEEEELLEKSLTLLVQECEILLKGDSIKVPTVKFGKTNLDMPIVTLGCMRFQQEWGPRIQNMNQVDSDCQDNLVAILRRAFATGMMHIETARMYGCSELQLGVALQQVLATTKGLERKDLIIQTKVAPNANSVDFRAALELSMRNLKVDYLDLFAFHGLNFSEQISWVFGKEEGDSKVETCLDVVKEYVQQGKIRHIGFSTHGSTSHICECIRRGAGDLSYVNLHYHYFGSYTASGCGEGGHGNLEAVKLLQEKNMGVFVISPFDKGGKLYAPSKKLRKLILPESEPITFMSHWIWNHHKLVDGMPPLHTYTLGAARPADLDQAIVAAHLHKSEPNKVVQQTKAIVARLNDARVKALGQDWVDTWWKGLPKSSQVSSLIEHNQIVWIYNNIKAFGMYEFGKNRYQSFQSNQEKWDLKLSVEQNIEKIGKNSWGFVPGLALTPGTDYTEFLKDVPPDNLTRVLEAHIFVHKWCKMQEETKPTPMRQIQDQVARVRVSISESTQKMRQRNRQFIDQLRNRNVPAGAQEATSGNKAENQDTNDTEAPEVQTIASRNTVVPTDWETSMNMTPWPDYPDQPSRAS